MRLGYPAPIEWIDLDVARTWGLLAQENGLQWFARKTENIVTGGRVRSIFQLQHTITWAAREHWHLYVHLNPTKDGIGRKASRQHILSWKWILVDLDPVVQRTSNRCVEELSLALQPAFNVFSGRGYQFWLPISPVPIIDMDQARFIERGTNRYLHQLKEEFQLWKWQVDTTTSDLARIVRCPGSVNPRTGEKSTFLTTVTGAHSPIPYLQLAAKEDLALAGETGAPLKDLNLKMALPHLTVTARKFLIRGCHAPGRHTTAWHTTKLLHEMGVTQDVARDWLYNAAKSCTPALSLGAIERRIAQVYGG